MTKITSKEIVRANFSVRSQEKCGGIVCKVRHSAATRRPRHATSFLGYLLHVSFLIAPSSKEIVAVADFYWISNRLMNVALNYCLGVEECYTRFAHALAGPAGLASPSTSEEDHEYGHKDEERKMALSSDQKWLNKIPDRPE